MITTVVVPAGDVQPLIVTVTLYIPLAAIVTFVIEGSSRLLEKPFGPDHVNVAVPVAVLVAFKFRVDPLHNAPLLAAVGAAGGLGSLKLNGPTGAEGQLLKTTYTLE